MIGILNTIELVVVAIAVAALATAGAVTLIRVAKGPTSLDRIISSDLVVGIVVGGFALHVVLTGRATTLPIMLAISLVGFIGAVAMARFVHDQVAVTPEDPRRLRRRRGGSEAGSSGADEGAPGTSGEPGRVGEEGS